MKSNCKKLNLNLKTFFSALDYFDRICSIFVSFDLKSLKQISDLCIILSAKLNENMVKEIRRRYDSGENPMSIQKDFSFVNINSIRRVCKRETWKNVI